VHDLSSAPPDAQDVLRKAKQKYGTLPNLEGAMAEAPALLEAYETGSELFAETTFSAVEREVVAMTVNVEHGCTYCVPWHTHISRAVGMTEGDLDALRKGELPETPRLEALARFTRAVLETRGDVSRETMTAFVEAGYSKRQALEVVLGVAVKVMSNFANAMAEPPLDAAVEDDAWEG
jgi:uncharacterized peroxidase-related enzyme